MAQKRPGWMLDSFSALFGPVTKPSPWGPSAGDRCAPAREQSGEAAFGLSVPRVWAMMTAGRGAPQDATETPLRSDVSETPPGAFAAGRRAAAPAWRRLWHIVRGGRSR